MPIRTIAFLVLVCLSAREVSAQECTLEVASLNTAGLPANNDSGDPSLSFDGRFVAYASVASDLVQGDTNLIIDCFVTDRRTGVAERVSVTTAGVQANGPSFAPRLSADGRFVVFLSDATNLDPKDVDPIRDVYMHDRLTKVTTLVSERFGTGLKSVGCQEAEVSDDGRMVVFMCTDNDVLPGVLGWNTFVRDTWLGATELASVGPAGQIEGGGGYSPSISGDGRFVAFVNGLITWGNPGPNAQTAIWLRDRELGTTTAVTLTSTGEIPDCGFGSPSLSHDGRYAVFSSCSSNLLPLSQPHGVYDAVRWDRWTGEYKTVSKSPIGTGLQNIVQDPYVSADGTKVVYFTGAGNATTGSQRSNNLVLVDLITDTSRSLMWNEAGDIANSASTFPAVSGDGRTAAFDSYASNLLRGTLTNATQVYVRSCDTALPMAYCTPAKGSTGCTMRIGSTGGPSASAGSGFDVRLEHAPAQAPLLLFYGTSGPWGTPFGSGYLCVKAPVKRAVAGTSGAGANCALPWSTDFNAFVASGIDPELGPGAVVHLQGWARNSAGESQLSDGLALVLEP